MTLTSSPFSIPSPPPPLPTPYSLVLPWWGGGGGGMRLTGLRTAPCPNDPSQIVKVELVRERSSLAVICCVTAYPEQEMSRQRWWYSVPEVMWWYTVPYLGLCVGIPYIGLCDGITYLPRVVWWYTVPRVVWWYTVLRLRIPYLGLYRTSDADINVSADNQGTVLHALDPLVLCIAAGTVWYGIQ